MPSLTIFTRFNKALFTLCCSLLFSIYAQANDFEITSLVGYTFSPKLTNTDKTTSIPTTDEPNLAFAFSWKDSATGQGQLLVNYIPRDFSSNNDQSNHSFDTLYAHFNGVAFFKERGYITTVGMGIGATHFKSDYSSATYPSITVAVGTRYEFSDNLTLITELRAYATLTKDNDKVFCQNDTCLAHFDDSIWIDSQISIGLAYSF